MIKYLPLFMLILCSYLTTYGQVGISADRSLPHNSAMLDIKSSTKGLLIPRTSSTTRNSIPSAKGLLIYDTTTASFWFHTGATWNELSSDNSGWSLKGNAATDPSISFIGTADNQPLRFRLNNTWSGEWNYTTRNYSIGRNAGRSITTGIGNIAIGNEALRNTTNTEGLIAIGDSALYANTTSIGNTATGNYALKSNTTGDFNTAVGFKVLSNNTTGFRNTALGYFALQGSITGYYNTALGYHSLDKTTTGYSNTSIGALALGLNISGTNNTAVGFNAMYGIEAGTNNTAIGSDVAVAGGDHQYATVIGAGAWVTCSNCLALGGFRESSRTKVGINNQQPLTDLHIIQQSNANGDATRGIRIQSPTGNYWRTFIDPGNNYVFEYMNGVFAYIDPSGVFHNTSDARLKKDIAPLGSVLQKVTALQAKTYHYIHSDRNAPLLYGFLAQDVEKLFPEFVSVTENGYKSIAYNNFSVVAIQAIQEQQQTIEELKARIEKLEKLLLINK